MGRMCGELSHDLKSTDGFKTKDKKQFAHRASVYLADLNFIHPFSDGNGRIQRLFLQNLAQRCGFSLDYQKLKKTKWMEASIDSYNQPVMGQHAKMSAVIEGAISGPSLDCNHLMTSCWSKSSTGKKYPYYLCRNKSCEMKGKSIPRDEIEDAFQHVLKDLQPNRSRFELAAKMFTRTPAEEYKATLEAIATKRDQDERDDLIFRHIEARERLALDKADVLENYQMVRNALLAETVETKKELEEEPDLLRQLHRRYNRDDGFGR